MAFKLFSLDYISTIVVFIVAAYGLLLLYSLVQDMRGKKCLKWTSRYNFWTKQYYDVFPCMDWE